MSRISGWFVFNDGRNILMSSLVCSFLQPSLGSCTYYTKAQPGKMYVDNSLACIYHVN